MTDWIATPYIERLEGTVQGTCGECDGTVLYGWTGEPKIALYYCDTCGREWPDPQDLAQPIEREA